MYAFSHQLPGGLLQWFTLKENPSAGWSNTELHVLKENASPLEAFIQHSQINGHRWTQGTEHGLQTGSVWGTVCCISNHSSCPHIGLGGHGSPSMSTKMLCFGFTITFPDCATEQTIHTPIIFQYEERVWNVPLLGDTMICTCQHYIQNEGCGPS